MKPFRLDTELAAIPAGALIELHQAPGSSKNNEPAAIAASIFATAAANAATQADLDTAEASLATAESDIVALESSDTEQIAGGTIDTPDATADGLTTGLIAATAQNVVYTFATNADDILSLPVAVDGKLLRLTGSGAELRSVVAGDKVNNVIVGATNEAALVAGVMYTLIYEAATSNWRMTGVDALGAVTVPVVPDAV